MTWSFPLGRLFGSELRVHATFLLLLLWIGISAYLSGGLTAALVNVAFIVALFACVIAHEFGHALMARRFGIRTPDVTLLPIGGMARLEKMPDKPGQEIAVALMGPVVSVVLGVAFLLLSGGAPHVETLEELGQSPQAFLAALGVVNLTLALFNLIPAFPMDGGRVLRAVLDLFMDRVQATKVAATAGQILAFGFGLLGLTSGNIMLILIAFFIFMAAGAESSEVAMRAVARNLMARDAMITNFEALAPADTLDTAAKALIRTTQHEFPVQGSDGRLLGFLSRNALFAALAEGTRTGQVSEVMETAIPVVVLTEGLETVLEQMQGPASAVAVVSAQGEMLGYITRENVGELMVVANTSPRDAHRP